MIRTQLLNAELVRAVASMGHGDLMIVCDAGFPIPPAVWRIDLAIVPDVPDLRTVLSALAADQEAVPHETILFTMAARAKVIVRTGAFDPWGNVLLYSGVDVPQWFNKPGVVAPDYYARRMK
jgi:D-ribose pyranase